MVQNPPEGYQSIIPYICYEDGPAAIDFLVQAFGFEEIMRMPMPDGRIGHAELRQFGSVIMVSSTYTEMGLASPKDLPAHHGQVMCYVEDVDAHHERAKAAGATITQEPEDQFYGDRSYRAVDPEGHRWIFSQHFKDVSEEEMQAHAE